jgi:HD-GYP domain-containing protein (c-di-GMP phosphodiesterase class II)
MNPSMRSRLLFLVFVLAALLVAWKSDAPAEDEPGPRVLVLHSYAPDFSWTRDLHDGIVSVLQSPEVRGRYRVEYMDAKHHSSPAYLEKLLRLYREKYTLSRFDGIILTDDHALDLVARYQAELFPQTPIVACGIGDINSIPTNARDMNIIIESLAHRETLGAALKQNPQTRTVFVMIDNTLTGQFILRDFMAQTQDLTRLVQVEVVPAMTREKLTQFARERGPGELIYLLVYFQDAAGQVFTAEEIPRVIADNSPVPVYVAWDFQLGSGVVGGCVTSAFGHGQKAAQTLVERLNGKNPPATYSELLGVNRHTYDYTALQRFAIPESSLPENSVILNRPLSYFEAHRSAIITALVVIGILSVIIVLLILNVLKKHKINLGNMQILALNREMIETQVELLAILGDVIETRSHDTANHVRRVSAYSALLGQKYGLDPDDVSLLESAALMHDIGKIGIPDAILNKSGRLTPAEFEKIKHHTTIGHRILHSSHRKLMCNARDIALQHHECWDGSGYPCGLKGEEISLLARICALADVYDALSLGRVYKAAWPKEKVLRFIREERGGVFDPRIVDLFFENLDELEAIKLRLSDPAGLKEEDSISGPVHCPVREV